jgi:hypothetical protein
VLEVMPVQLKSQHLKIQACIQLCMREFPELLPSSLFEPLVESL